jgi:FtsH ternary system-associated peptide
MCNPRRVMVNLSRSIEQSWRALIEQTVRVEGQVQELARISTDIALGDELGDVALEVFERVLRGEFEGFDPWERDNDGNYHYDLGDVLLIYQPGSRQLLIEVRLTELISADARGTAEATGMTVGDVAVEAIGHYYSDGWGGRTREFAKKEAETRAEQKLIDAVEDLHRQQHAAEIEAAETQARAYAEREASIALEQARQAMRAAMRERLQVILANAEDRIYHIMNRLVAETYRQSLIQLVRDNGGRVLADERSGSVMNLELELF